MTVASSRTPAVTGNGTAASPLDERRSRWLASQQRAAEAQNALTALDQQLAAVAAQADADHAALETAITQQAVLRKQLKSAAKRHDRLRAGRKDARRVAKKARRRAKTDEAKFEKALLEDMLQKAKSADLAKNAGAAASTATTAVEPAPRKRSATNGRRRTDSPKPSTRRASATTNGRPSAG